MEAATRIATTCGKSKEVGLQIAKAAHKAATGTEPPEGWGEFTKNQTRTRK